MQLIDELKAEHDLIDQVLGSLRAHVEARALGLGSPADGLDYIRFFRTFAGTFHHAREEDILFAALAEKAELPTDRGPLAVMTADHARMGALLADLAELLALPTLDPAAIARLRALALAYSHALWNHIDAENSVLLPESEDRLRRHHVRDLPTRPMTAEEAEARACGVRLLAVHPPLFDATALRGDGCGHCTAYGDTCRGLEREWWNEWEWEDFQEFMPKD